ncbi:MAG TPA: hypothetical protein VM012_13865 [Flavitalea sp.]|nr:hypothetical protein [Flavitalea sp.]
MTADRDQHHHDNARTNDISDSQRDKERLRKEETFIDLPDVKDIPGQENITVPPLGELSDVTISSDDEEGRGVLDDEDDQRVSVRESDVSKKQLPHSAETWPNTLDEKGLERASLDRTDNEGDALNEKSFGDHRDGSDLDVPGSENDDANEEIGEEDEENNNYSIGGEG